jgi:hypothetical protein
MSGLSKTMCAAIISTLLLMSIGPVFKLDQDYSAQALTLFQDSFESGTFDSWSGLALASGDTANVSKAIPYDGSYSALFQTNASTSETRKSCVYANVNGTASFYVRGYFYIADGLPLGANGGRFGLIAFKVGSTILASFRIFRTGGIDRFNIIGFNGSGNYPSRSTDVVYPQENQWYCVEFYAKVHTSAGEYRAWINGAERLSITGVNSAVLGNITTVWWGLPFSIGLPNSVTVYGDSAVIADSYTGPSRSTFGVVGSVTSDYAIRNFYWLFGNQSISYNSLLPSEITNFADVDRFDGLVLWTRNAAYNSTAIKRYAQTHIVIVDIWDFCNGLYPTLASSLRIVSTATVTYNMDWGNFRSGDLVEMRNETGNIDQLTTVIASGLATLSNIRIIAQFDSSHVAFFHMNGTKPNSGFYVMDLDATTPETEFTGIWHIFPAIKMVRDFPTGKNARWMANGQEWYDLSWVYSRIDSIVSQYDGIVRKMVIGKSVQNQDIPAIMIGTGSNYAIIDGSMHGNEKTGTFASLRIAELLASYCQTSFLWRSRLTDMTAIIVPVLNPDGFASNTRENAHGVDLNSQFPPDGTPTEPEAWALVNLMGNYTPTVYINFHEGYNWYPLDMLCGNYETGSGRTATIDAMQQANQTFVDQQHWGWFTEQNSNVWIGGVNAIYSGGKEGMAIAYSSYQYHASSMLVETFVWSPTWGARKCLWGLDYYTAVSMSFLAARVRILFADNFETGNFASWDGNQTTTWEALGVTNMLSKEGMYSAGFAADGNQSFGAAYVYKNLQPSTTLFARGYFLATSFTATGNYSRYYFAAFVASGQIVAIVGCRIDGISTFWTLAIWNSSGWVIIDSQASRFLNHWHRFELQWAQSPTDGYGKLYVDNLLVSSITRINTTAFGTVDSARFGISMSGNAKTVFFLDYVQVSSISLGPLPLIEDLNQDFKIDTMDVAIAARSFGTAPGSSQWDPRADLNADSKVDMKDVAEVAVHFGEKIV